MSGGAIVRNGAGVRAVPVKASPLLDGHLSTDFPNCHRSVASVGLRRPLAAGPGGPYAEMEPGFVIDYLAVRSATWTDTKPSPPAALPFR
jgi:hypothetical protein